MNLSVIINGIERRGEIDWRAFRINDILTSQTDTCSFKVKATSSEWKPEEGQEIVVLDGTLKIFGGTIIKVTEDIRGRLLEYNVRCVDRSYKMDGKEVIETYSNMTVNAIIGHIVANYVPAGFTTTNVDCPITINYIAFNHEIPSKCFQALAEAVNYNWYVDADRNIHFFDKFKKLAPFNLADDNDTYVFNSLRIEKDVSQIKNVVFVRGGEFRGATRSEEYSADGRQCIFNLSYKYAEAPTVKRDGVIQTVGVDLLNDFITHQALWNFNLRYIRFETPPAAGTVINIAGIPLFPVKVRVEELASITKYGERHFLVVDKTIETKEAARERATAELKAYKNRLKSGEFITNRSGLRSGHLINISSVIRGINENFLIRKVGLRMTGPNKGQWEVEIISIRALGIIEFLQNLLTDTRRKIRIDRNEILEKIYNIIENIGIRETISVLAQKPVHEALGISERIRHNPWGAGVIDFVWSEHIPVNDLDQRRNLVWDRGEWM